MTERRQRVLLAVIASIGLLRGLWWVAATPLWSPIDEQAHYDFVESVGRLDGIPIVGKTRVHRDVLAVEKSSSTSPWQSVPVPADPRRPEWSAIAQSYEAAQPPLYYALMAPVWRVAAGARTVATVYVLRIASLLLSLALIPLVWLIGRELVPDRPEVGLLAAGLLVVFSGANGNFAIVANDGLMTVLAAAAFLVMARAIKRGASDRRALAVGALVGAALLTKTTALSLVAIVAIGAAIATRNWREYARFGAIAGGITALVVAPWLVFNHAHYGGLTASKQLDAITGSLQTDPPLNLHGLATRLRQGGHGFFDAQLLATNVSRYALLWFGLAAVAGTVALARLWRARERGDAVTLVWLLTAWPIAFVTMAFVILHLSGGRSDIAGRHLYVALPAVAVGIAFAATRAFGRYALAALALVAAVGLTFEAHDAPGVMHAAYSAGAFENLAPVLDRPYADRVVTGGHYELSAPCPIVAVRLFFHNEIWFVDVNGQPTDATVEHGEGQTSSALYGVAARDTRVRLDVPQAARLSASRHGLAHQLYCVTPHNDDFRFRQTFRRGHLALTRAEVAFFPRAWAVIGWALFAAALSITRWGRRGSGARG